MLFASVSLSLSPYADMEKADRREEIYCMTSQHVLSGRFDPRWWLLK